MSKLSDYYCLCVNFGLTPLFISMLAVNQEKLKPDLKESFAYEKEITEAIGWLSLTISLPMVCLTVPTTMALGTILLITRLMLNMVRAFSEIVMEGIDSGYDLIERSYSKKLGMEIR